MGCLPHTGARPRAVPGNQWSVTGFVAKRLHDEQPRAGHAVYRLMGRLLSVDCVSAFWMLPFKPGALTVLVTQQVATDWCSEPASGC